MLNLLVPASSFPRQTVGSAVQLSGNMQSQIVPMRSSIDVLLEDGFDPVMQIGDSLSILLDIILTLTAVCVGRRNGTLNRPFPLR